MTLTFAASEAQVSRTSTPVLGLASQLDLLQLPVRLLLDFRQGIGNRAFIAQYRRHNLVVNILDLYLAIDQRCWCFLPAFAGTDITLLKVFGANGWELGVPLFQ